MYRRCVKVGLHELSILRGSRLYTRSATSEDGAWRRLSRREFDCAPGIPLLRHRRLLSGSWQRAASTSFTQRFFSDEACNKDKLGGEQHVLACDAEDDGGDDEGRISAEEHHQARFLTQKARYKKLFEDRLVKWEDLKVTLEDFPHYLSGTTRDLLVDCAAAHLRQPSYAEYGSGLLSSSRRICLRGPAGTHLHQERLVEALAHHLRVPLLVLNSTTLAPHDFGAHEPMFSGNSNFDSESESSTSGTLHDESEEKEEKEARLRGAQGFKVDVLLEMDADSVEAKRQLLKVNNALGVETEQGQENSAFWEPSKADLSPDNASAADPCEEWVAAIDALCEMAPPSRPLVVYFPDPKQWFERAVSLDRRQEFLERVEAKLDQIEGPIVLISSRTSDEEVEVDDRARLKAHLEDIRARLNQRTSTRWVFRELLGSEDVYELFPNHVKIYPPKEEGMLREWKKQLLSDKEISYAKHNIQQLREVLERNNMDCEELQALNLLDVNLSKTKAEKVVGWARNHHLGLCLSDPPTSNGKLMIPRDSMERALTRLRDQENKKAPSIVKDFKTVAEDEYEKALISAVIPPNEVGVKFDHIGALENVKSTLKELVMLPLQRPELFSKGNLTRPCKGVLLFGPPGTGKTLLAKAVATEAGANFINITGSTITSKWFGDAEKLTKSLFSLARKLSPAVIFVDEVDSLLGARGGTSEHEATRKTRNEFMAAWDGLRSRDSERVLVLAATNRPFDLDDAVIRRLPRRILVDLPNMENRVKILRVILAEEELEEGFDYEELSHLTDGYSGSDLKNLSIAAAYRPIRELLQCEEQEAKVGTAGGGLGAANRARSAALIRPLRFDDFKESMAQVGASVAFDASSMNELRRWNEQYGEGGNRRKSNFGFVV